MGRVTGVLTLGESGWVVANDSEVRVLEGLRGERGARDRLWALAAVLDTGLAEAEDLRRLNGRLSAISALQQPEEVSSVRVPDDLLGAAAFVCACVNDEMLSRWLGFALSARLNSNLVRWLLPGPGCASWSIPHRIQWRSYDRATYWISEMPDSFWSRLQAHRDERLRAVAAASDPTARPKALENLANRHLGDPEVLDLVASHPRTPTRVLRRLVWHGKEVSLRVAQNRSATAGLLGELAKSIDYELRCVAASHPKLPVSALSRLARDESHWVRAAVARAEAAAASALEALASDADVRVRSWVASNPSAPPAALEVLLDDRSAVVRAPAAANENTPAELVRDRVQDRAKRVRSRLAERSDVGAEVLTVLAGDPKEAVREAVAHNPQTPSEVLDGLAGDCCGEVRAAVASNSNTRRNTLQVLAGDDYWWVRNCLAANKSAPTEVLRVLTGDEDVYVRGDAAENAAMPRALLKTLARHEAWEVRAGVALNSTTPEEILECLAADSHSDVRRCLCHNDEIPQRLLGALSSDPNYGVRAAAAAACERRRSEPHSDSAPRRDLT